MSDKFWEAQPGRPYLKLNFPRQGISGLGPEDNFLQDPRGQDAHAVLRYTGILLIFVSRNHLGLSHPVAWKPAPTVDEDTDPVECTFEGYASR